MKKYFNFLLLAFGIIYLFSINTLFAQQQSNYYQGKVYIDPELNLNLDGPNTFSDEIISFVIDLHETETAEANIDFYHGGYSTGVIASYHYVKEEYHESAMRMQSPVVESLKKIAENNFFRYGENYYYEQLYFVNMISVIGPKSLIAPLIKRHLNSIKGIYNGDSEAFIDEPEVIAAKNTCAEGKYTEGLEVLNIPKVNELNPNLQGQGIVVGIIDTGIDHNHPELAGKVVRWKDFINDRDTPYDDNDHGTHCAGTIAGGNIGGSQIGVAPETSLIIAKAFTGAGGGTLEGTIRAMNWMIDPDNDPSTDDFPQVVSNSWGGPFRHDTPAEDPRCKIVDRWLKLGILPVFAAGNSGPRSSSVSIPGGCPGALAVGATDFKDEIARFSSRGPAKWKNMEVIKPNISAPGVAVCSSVAGGEYKVLSGTSMATPHIAGIAALMIQDTLIRGEEFRTGPVEIVERLGSTAIDLGIPGADNTFGLGRVDAADAIFGIF